MRLAEQYQIPLLMFTMKTIPSHSVPKVCGFFVVVVALFCFWIWYFQLPYVQLVFVSVVTVIERLFITFGVWRKILNQKSKGNIWTP